MRAVRDTALRERHEVLDEADRRAELLVHGARPLRVALGEVVVHGDEVHATAREAVQVERLHGDERLALPGLHLGDVALVQHDPAHELDVEEPNADRPPERLPDRRVRLEDDLLQRLAVLDPLLELHGLRRELVVGERLEVRLEGSDVRRLLLQALEPASLAHAQDALEPPADLRGHGG